MFRAEEQPGEDPASFGWRLPGTTVDQGQGMESGDNYLFGVRPQNVPDRKRVSPFEGRAKDACRIMAWACLLLSLIIRLPASLLVKDLHIDWRWGEKYFAQHLVDYDPAVNNGNWQWAASTGCDAQPYFRIFNPWLQQKKFDPDCDYIKKWVPELRRFDARKIHGMQKGNRLEGYPEAIVDHLSAKQAAEAMFVKASKKEAGR